jgi:hypothetical protein
MSVQPLSGNLDDLEYATHNVLGGDFLGFCFVAEHHAVPQYIGSNGFDVLWGDIASVA